MNPPNLMRYATRAYNIKLKTMIGKTFQRLSDPTAPGPKTMQTWMVVRHLDKDVYECKLINHVQDVMLTSNPQIRTFREAEINKYINKK